MAWSVSHNGGKPLVMRASTKPVRHALPVSRSEKDELPEPIKSGSLFELHFHLANESNMPRSFSPPSSPCPVLPLLARGAFSVNICGPLSVRSIPTIAPPSVGDTDRQVEFSLYTLLLNRQQLDSWTLSFILAPYFILKTQRCWRVCGEGNLLSWLCEH